MARVNLSNIQTQVHQEYPHTESSLCKKIITIAQNFFSQKIVFCILIVSLFSPVIAIVLHASYFVLVACVSIQIISIFLSILILTEELKALKAKAKTTEEILTEELKALKAKAKTTEEIFTEELKALKAKAKTTEEIFTEELQTLNDKFKKLRNSIKKVRISDTLHISDTDSVVSTSSNEKFNELGSGDFNQINFLDANSPPNIDSPPDTNSPPNIDSPPEANSPPDIDSPPKANNASKTKNTEAKNKEIM